MFNTKDQVNIAWAVEVDGEISARNIVETRSQARELKKHYDNPETYGAEAKTAIRKVGYVVIE